MKQICDCQGMVICGERSERETTKEHMDSFEDKEYVHCLYYDSFKTPQMVYVKYVQLIVCQLYFSKSEKIMMFRVEMVEAGIRLGKNDNR